MRKLVVVAMMGMILFPLVGCASAPSSPTPTGVDAPSGVSPSTIPIQLGSGAEVEEFQHTDPNGVEVNCLILVQAGYQSLSCYPSAHKPR